MTTNPTGGFDRALHYSRLRELETRAAVQILRSLGASAEAWLQARPGGRSTAAMASGWNACARRSMSPKRSPCAACAASCAAAGCRVWRNKYPPPDYVIVEAKYGKGSMGKTLDGKQSSDDWVNGTTTGFDRLKSAVGKAFAADIKMSSDQEKVEKWLLWLDEFGNVSKKY